MGSGSILLNRKKPNGFQESKKRNTSDSLSYHMTPKQSNKEKNSIPARNYQITNAFNLITYIYLYKASGVSFRILEMDEF